MWLIRCTSVGSFASKNISQMFQGTFPKPGVAKKQSDLGSVYFESWNGPDFQDITSEKGTDFNIPHPWITRQFETVKQSPLLSAKPYEYVPLPWSWKKRIHLCLSPTYQLQNFEDITHSLLPETYSSRHATSRAGRSSTMLWAVLLFHPRSQPARCLQSELNALLNRLTQCSTQNNNSWQGSAQGIKVDSMVLWFPLLWGRKDRENDAAGNVWERDEDGWLSRSGQGDWQEQNWSSGSHVQATLYFEESELMP